MDRAIHRSWAAGREGSGSPKDAVPPVIILTCIFRAPAPAFAAGCAHVGEGLRVSVTAAGMGASPGQLSVRGLQLSDSQGGRVSETVPANPSRGGATGAEEGRAEIPRSLQGRLTPRPAACRISWSELLLRRRSPFGFGPHKVVDAHPSLQTCPHGRRKDKSYLKEKSLPSTAPFHALLSMLRCRRLLA